MAARRFHGAGAAAWTRASAIFTAVLTDPDGVDDIVGGTLSNESGAIGYGPFVAAGQAGTYSITLAWDAVHLAEAIEFEAMELTRVFQAEFYDQAGHKVRKDVSLALMPPTVCCASRRSMAERSAFGSRCR